MSSTKRAFRAGLTYELGRYPQGLIDKKKVRRQHRAELGGAPLPAGNEPPCAVKPIRWLIAEVDIEKRQALLISKKGLDCRPYHSLTVNPGWEASELRRWLNGDFLQEAFTSEELERLLPAGHSGAEPQERVFILSKDELDRYLPAISERRCQITAYAFSRGGYCDDQGDCCWWLRTDPKEADKCSVISYGGGAYEMEADFAHNCIRPAIRIAY
ncbi:hypothetical protein IJT93_05505 [bacterium]|nr:hypothetical protein [bacterium]